MEIDLIRNKLEMAKFCKQCGHTVAEKGDCLLCGAYKVRLSRALKSLNDAGEAHVVRCFNILDKEEKAKFNKNH